MGHVVAKATVNPRLLRPAPVWVISLSTKSEPPGGLQAGRDTLSLRIQEPCGHSWVGTVSFLESGCTLQIQGCMCARVPQRPEALQASVPSFWEDLELEARWFLMDPSCPSGVSQYCQGTVLW